MSKRELIISALGELSHAKGFYRVTVDELAARAGVSKRTIYRYFRSKDEIIEALLDRFMHQMAAGIEQAVRTEEKPAGVFSGVIRLVFQHGRYILNPQVLDDLRRHYPGLWKKLDRFRAEKIRQIIIKGLVEKYKGKGLREIDPRILEAAFLAAVQAVVNPEFILDNNLTPEDTARQLIEIFVYGIFEEVPDKA